MRLRTRALLAVILLAAGCQSSPPAPAPTTPAPTSARPTLPADAGPAEVRS